MSKQKRDNLARKEKKLLYEIIYVEVVIPRREGKRDLVF